MEERRDHGVFGPGGVTWRIPVLGDLVDGQFQQVLGTGKVSPPAGA
jgi:hypothetical protein